MEVRTAIGLVWLAGLFAPFGFFLVSWRERMLGAAVSAASLIAIPWLTPVLPLTGIELTAAFSGLALGFLARRVWLARDRAPAQLSNPSINE
jgi:hypothetical protein